MRFLSAIVISATTLVASAAFAQGVDLTGRYLCVQGCSAPGQVAFVTQNGWNLNLTNEVGEPSRAWIDWYGHLWAQQWNEGAVYSADGLTIQFDRGTVWQRDLEPLPAPALIPVPGPARGKRAVVVSPAPVASAAPRARGTNAFDGSWSVLILTQNGPCDPAYRYGVQITNGFIMSEIGGVATIQGRVAPNGAVQVSVSSSVGQAEGGGRLLRASGNGTWQGQSPNGACAGTWQAERRG